MIAVLPDRLQLMDVALSSSLLHSGNCSTMASRYCSFCDAAHELDLHLVEAKSGTSAPGGSSYLEGGAVGKVAWELGGQHPRHLLPITAMAVKDTKEYGVAAAKAFLHRPRILHNTSSEQGCIRRRGQAHRLCIVCT